MVEFDYDKIVNENNSVECKTFQQLENFSNWANSVGLRGLMSDVETYVVPTDVYICSDGYMNFGCFCGKRVLKYEEALLMPEGTQTITLPKPEKLGTVMGGIVCGDVVTTDGMLELILKQQEPLQQEIEFTHHMDCSPEYTHTKKMVFDGTREEVIAKVQKMYPNVEVKAVRNFT